MLMASEKHVFVLKKETGEDKRPFLSLNVV